MKMFLIMSIVAIVVSSIDAAAVGEPQIGRHPRRSSRGDSNDPDSACICPRIFWPVCGSDNETYSNSCTLRCRASKKGGSGLKIARQGACDESEVGELEQPELFLPELAL